MQCKQLIAAALDHAGHAQFAQARRGRRGAPAAEGCHVHTGGQEQLDAMTVANMKYLERFPLGAEVQPAIRQHAVNVQDQQLDFRKRRGSACFQNTPARNRSCTLSAPTSFRSSSSTMSE